jgi:Arylsulfotransferase (ASST)
MLSIRTLILGPALALGLAAAAGESGAAAAQAGPTCTPAVLNSSAEQSGAVTISPVPGSRDASPQTQISFRGVPAGRLGAVSVVGSRTGAHSGRLLAYSQGDGASFVPARPFVPGERVTVRARVRVGHADRALLDAFAVASPDPISSTPEPIHPGGGSDVQSFLSRPDLHPPAVTVTAASAAAGAGDVFVAPYSGPGQAGPMILDANGGVVWFKALPRYTSATNLRVQQYEGRPVLTWWQGDISVHGFGLGEGVIDDSSYSTIARVRAGNGQSADLHDFQLTPAGTALITAFAPVYCDLAAVGGPSYGAVTDGIVQEVDVKTGLVRYEWTSLDHVGLSESYERPANSSTGWPFDFFHVNSISLDYDGSLLISARNTWTVYEIDPRSGQIAWRLGGRKSSFSAGAGTRTAWQHDPRELPDGTISLFDNGASPAVRSQSRGIVVSVDPKRRAATLVSQFTHGPALLAASQGNMQALANGDWFLGWGQVPDFSEYGPQGQLLFDAHFPLHEQSYRSFRFPWTGAPAHRPTFVLQRIGGSPGVVFASWNGATRVAAWRVLAGRGPGALRAVAQAPRSGFETAVALPAGTGGPDLAVQALDGAGDVLGASATVTEPSLPPAR